MDGVAVNRMVSPLSFQDGRSGKEKTLNGKVRIVYTFVRAGFLRLFELHPGSIRL